MPSLACHAGAGSNSLVQTAPVIYCCLFTFPSSTHAHTHAPTHTHSMQGAAGPAWGEAVLGLCRAGGRWDTRLSPAKEACLVRRRCAPCCTYILGALPSWRPWTLRGAHPMCGCLCRAGAGCCPAEPQQCAFVGGDGSWLQQLSLGSAGSERPTWMCISGWAWRVAPASSCALQQGFRPQCLLAGLPGGLAVAVLSGCPAAQ